MVYFVVKLFFGAYPPLIPRIETRFTTENQVVVEFIRPPERNETRSISLVSGLVFAHTIEFVNGDEMVIVLPPSVGCENVTLEAKASKRVPIGGYVYNSQRSTQVVVNICAP